MVAQRTFVMIKPDGVKRGLIGEIISRFEKRGLKIVSLKMVKMSRDTAEKLYEEHKGKSFFEELVNYVTSGPVVCMVIEGDDVVQVIRRMIGNTDPKEAPPGTIRGDYALSKSENVIHASDSIEKAQREMSLFFDKSDL
ncbi:nucleoside-diphosphate kinase [Saccharolobus solfataricus]|uniref:Nucleoside diphosphate kinase n=3 Tax=Saccharolobus solfataricus TaxID=2287 RepID=NDK_SACS2|nr:nucleoside-diphosphate kinase [Saccharolobus solfataricus]Q980Q7.1 RecName: Full=Nucleoside diphosphate kinase; Short=NDK; Short=NDP kinase; AltName: Full=Nucleoside-2-P kinase [Saccharolobus solfataricus P2]AAK40571.1 Nucleoside diphosphate kinase (NDP kinase) (ndk) [Saccharolobus solfataricus P2]AKA73551.1 nucleoside-diphosphate kinase [Saccharolobus solfataricus]AKA76249.1 nucleoside-diphosphate kinase [Saccharolobus solfataricus]AKA78941.1 nucleoside-diphosphate kinase [Saccharolobus so